MDSIMLEKRRIMNPVQQEIINKCKLDFLKISARKQLDIQDKALLVANITQILGIYELKYDKQLYHLLLDMIRFGENSNLVLAGQRLHLDELNRRYKVPVDYKHIKWEPSFLK